jgi:hypothetical protein
MHLNKLIFTGVALLISQFSQPGPARYMQGVPENIMASIPGGALNNAGD